jgi:hypothetical protein
MAQPHLKRNIELREKALQRMGEAFGDLEFRYSLGPLSYLAQLGYDMTTPEQYKVGKNPYPYHPSIYGFHANPGITEDDLRWLASQMGYNPKKEPIEIGDIGITKAGVGKPEIWQHELRHKGSTYIQEHAGTPLVPENIFPSYEHNSAEELVQRLYDALKGDKKAWGWLNNAASYITSKYKTQEQFMDENVGAVELYEQQAKKLLERRKGHQVTPEQWMEFKKKWE